MSSKRHQTQSAWEQASGKQQQTQCGEPRNEKKVARRAVAPPARPAFARTQVKVWHEGAD